MPVNATQPLNSGATVTTTSALLVAGNSARSKLAIVNTGAYNVYLSKGVPAVVGKGIMIAANGGSTSYQDLNNWLGAIYAIADGGSSITTYLEEYI